MMASNRHPLVVITRVLAERMRGREPSIELRAVLASGTIDWERVVEQASDHYVVAAFAAAVRELGLAELLGPELSEFLAAVHAANVERNADLLDQLTDLVAALNRIGVKPVLLKGAIRLVDGLYPDIGWRMMRDLDLLVPAARLADAVGALCEIGYTPNARLIEANPRAFERHHYPGLLHPDRAAPVEIHTELFKTPRRQRLLRAVEVLAGSRPVRFGNVVGRLPSPEYQLVHLIGHGQISNRAHVLGRVELRDQLEAAVLLRALPDSIDWEAIFARFAAAGYRRPLLNFLLALDDGSFCPVPPLPGRIDWLSALQQRRIALQARSTVLTRANEYPLRLARMITRTLRTLTARHVRRSPLS